MTRRILVTLILWLAAGGARAGSLVNGEWKTANCPQKPAAPEIDVKTVEAYNKSITLLNAWQNDAKTYYECMVNEANADTKTIADAANREQTEYRQTFDTIVEAVETAKKKFER